MEIVIENVIDGVIVLLFYVLLGVIIFNIGSIFLVFVYKVVSILDLMVGYKEVFYIDLGWFSVKLEDVLIWLFCCLNVVIIVFFFGKFLYVCRIC